jgi:predicted DNA-binding transcriptional regulator AlpA
MSTALPVKKLLSKKEVLARVPFSQGTLYRLLRENKFPRPVILGVRLRGWHEEEVDAFLEGGVEVALPKFPPGRRTTANPAPAKHDGRVEQ